MSMAIPRPGSRRAWRGFALLVVLWFLVLLAAVGTYLMANARSETALAHNVLAGAKSEALADSGIAQAAFNLTDPLPANRWKFDGMPHQMKLPGGEVTIRLDDESKKINPNLASESAGGAGPLARSRAPGPAPGRAALQSRSGAARADPA